MGEYSLIFALTTTVCVFIASNPILAIANAILAGIWWTKFIFREK